MKPDNHAGTERSDVVINDDPQVVNAILESVRERAVVAPVAQEDREFRAKSDVSFAMRLQLIEGQQSDPNGFERIIGKSELLSINFLERGRRAADAVCRIKLPVVGGHAFATGFLVGPRLLLTNNHVLSTVAEATQAEAEFGFEHDADGVLKPVVQFNFDPSQVFFTSTELDVTLVAVAPMSDGGVPLERYGWLPLIPVSGKSVDGEWISIVQHPNGDPKQIAIHASQVIKLDAQKFPVNTEHFIHYSTDTEPGSSGSPVLNDQWQVVAIHHKAVPEPRSPGAAPGEPMRWLANEGVRISAVFKLLERERFRNENARVALDGLSRAMGFAPIMTQVVADGVTSPGGALSEQSAPFKKERWLADGLGYKADFLSTQIALEPIYAPLLATDLVAPLKDGSGHELRYWHFSSVLHKQRCFPLMTAVNIDGSRLIHPGKRVNTWRQDLRIDAKYQPDDDFYVAKNAEEKVYFSRGHLVRLLDPCWGEGQEEAKRGMDDSFHFTNAAPQQQTYNDIDWGNLEDYVLNKAQTNERKISVFTGPIFGDHDPSYGKHRKGGPWLIPLSFWKIAVLQKTHDQIAVAAFIIGQTEYVKALYEARVFSGLKPYTIDEIRSRKIQTTVAAVEEATGLDFSALRPFDAHGGLESTRQTRWFNRLEDVLI